MVTHLLSRAFLSNSKVVASIFPRSFSSLSLSSKHSSSSLSLLFLNRLRPLAVVSGSRFIGITGPTVRGLSTRRTSSSVNDPNPNWSNRPPKETILLDGCDFEHWLVVMDPPEGEPTRDEIIDSYIKTLAMVIGSEEEARMKIYSVSTRCYYAFGALVSEELSYKLKELPRVRWVLPDSYLDVKNKDYGGEPFINGQAVPYDPKYHEEWIRNNARANERNRRNDRPRNFDRSRNYERRRENMQNREFQNQGMQNPPLNMSSTPPNIPPSSNTPPNMGRMPPNVGGMPQSNMGGIPPQNNLGGGMPPQNSMGGMPPQKSMGGMPPQNHYGGMPLQNNYGGMPPQNSMGGMPPQNYGGMPPQNNYGGMPPQNNYGGMPPQNKFGGMPPQNNYGGMSPQDNYGGIPSANNYGGMPPSNEGNMGGMPPNAGWSDKMLGNTQQSADGPTHQNAAPNTQFQK